MLTGLLDATSCLGIFSFFLLSSTLCWLCTSSCSSSSFFPQRPRLTAIRPFCPRNCWCLKSAFCLHVPVCACAPWDSCNINAATWDAAPVSLRSPTINACLRPPWGSTVVAAPRETGDGLSVKTMCFRLQAASGSFVIFFFFFLLISGCFYKRWEAWDIPNN